MMTNTNRLKTIENICNEIKAVYLDGGTRDEMLHLVYEIHCYADDSMFDPVERTSRTEGTAQEWSPTSQIIFPNVTR